jgi:hypothetical protein
MKFHPDYKKLYDACQDGCNRLRIERDAAERRYQDMVVEAKMNSLKEPMEKIVEKEVLPWWVRILTVGMLISYFLWTSYSIREMLNLNEPILSPYPVYITKIDPSYVNGLRSCMNAFNDCHTDYCLDHPRLKGCRP